MAENTLINELLAEWTAFRDTAAHRHPDSATACVAWTTRDIMTHQAGNAVELGRVLAALDHVIAELARILERGLDDPDAWVPWTGRQMKVAWFGEHMRSELILHRWDLVGDDELATRQLAQPWMTTHAVEAVGQPLLRRGAAELPGTSFTARLRVSDRPDVILTGGADPNISLGPARTALNPP